jgi:hypothetical protein
MSFTFFSPSPSTAAIFVDMKPDAARGDSPKEEQEDVAAAAEGEDYLRLRLHTAQRVAVVGAASTAEALSTEESPANRFSWELAAARFTTGELHTGQLQENLFEHDGFTLGLQRNLVDLVDLYVHYSFLDGTQDVRPPTRRLRHDSKSAIAGKLVGLDVMPCLCRRLFTAAHFVLADLFLQGWRREGLLRLLSRARFQNCNYYANLLDFLYPHCRERFGEAQQQQQKKKVYQPKSPTLSPAAAAPAAAASLLGEVARARDEERQVRDCMAQKLLGAKMPAVNAMCVNTRFRWMHSYVYDALAEIVEVVGIQRHGKRKTPPEEGGGEEDASAAAAYGGFKDPGLLFAETFQLVPWQNLPCELLLRVLSHPRDPTRPLPTGTPSERRVLRAAAPHLLRLLALRHLSGVLSCAYSISKRLYQMQPRPPQPLPFRSLPAQDDWRLKSREATDILYDYHEYLVSTQEGVPDENLLHNPFVCTAVAQAKAIKEETDEGEDDDEEAEEEQEEENGAGEDESWMISKRNQRKKARGKHARSRHH